jgi:aspartate aminotransferase-like enzyme
MKRMKLLIPGPVELSPEVLQEMARPLIGHRTPDFEEILVECWEGMKELYQTRNDVVLITGSGTAGMDAAVASTLREGEEVISITGGKFAERFVEIVRGYGGISREVPVEWGKSFSIEAVEEAVAESDAKAITLTHNETSTGVLHDARAVGKIARENDLLFIMDSISCIGGDEVKVDEWGVDLCIAGSQKCLVSPPGLAMVSVSERAWEVIAENPTRNFYLDLARYRKSLGKKTTPFTPSVSLVFGLRQALKEIQEEGLENRIQRHRILAKATRAAAKAVGLELFADPAVASNTVTSIRIPEGLTDDDIRGRMKREHGILLAGGQAQVKGKIFRIGHMGNVRYPDLIVVFAALERTLHAAGWGLELGAGVREIQKVLSA